MRADCRPRIALVIDTEGWAFSNIATQVQRHLSHMFDFEIISMTALAEVEEARWRDRGRNGPFSPGGGMAFGPLLIQSPSFDLIHIFWREYLLLADQASNQAYVRSIGLDIHEFNRRYVNPACITTAVYDHLFGSEEDLARRAPILNDLVSGYYVSSERLNRIYLNAPMLTPPLAVIEDGVDTDVFVPANLQRLQNVSERELVIGWVGNSRWSADVEDFKGVHTILKPTIERLKAEGLRVRLHMADRQDGFIPHHEMPKYYANIDLYVCTSKIEGTPNPVLEAMACGVPVISTDVGIVPQVFGAQQAQFLLEERSIDCLVVAIRRFLNNPTLMIRLSEENLMQIKKWSWHKQSSKFAKFFRSALCKQRNTKLEGA